MGRRLALVRQQYRRWSEYQHITLELVHDCTHVVVWSTLASGEDGSVDPSLNIGLLVLSEEDETSSGTPQSLVGGGGDDVTELEWRALFTGSDETRDMSHVGKEVSPLSIGDLPQSSVIPISGVGGSTTN